MHFHLLPVRSANAAENMAADFLLLRRYPDCDEMRHPVIRFRHYGWHRPAFTFGYGQKIADIRTLLPADVMDELTPCELMRRPSAGGLFDHRDDWAYAIVIPRGHDLEARGAVESYSVIHRALADALLAQGADVRLHDSQSGPDKASGRRDANEADAVGAATSFDVVDARTGRRVATAAQKRAKHGLLFQGTVCCPAAERAVPEGEEPVDWNVFYETFTARLADSLGAELQETPWPDLAEGELEALTEQYASSEWIEFR